MGTGIRYTDEFKQEAVNQVVVHGYSVSDVSSRLGISDKRNWDTHGICQKSSSPSKDFGQRDVGHY